MNWQWGDEEGLRGDGGRHWGQGSGYLEDKKGYEEDRLRGAGERDDEGSEGKGGGGKVEDMQMIWGWLSWDLGRLGCRLGWHNNTCRGNDRCNDWKRFRDDRKGD